MLDLEATVLLAQLAQFRLDIGALRQRSESLRTA